MSREPPFPASPEGLLGESRRLTDKIMATRREWAAGKGKDYGTAVDYIVSTGRRRVIVGELRRMFRVVGGRECPVD